MASTCGFPTTLRAERDDVWTGPELVSLAGRDVAVVGYLRPSAAATRLAVIDASGVEVATVAAPRVPPASRALTSPGFGQLARLLSPVAVLSADVGDFHPPAHCAHVMLLEGEADRDWATGIAYENETDLVVAGPTQRAVVEGALGLMTPLLCHGVARVVFGTIPSEPGVGGVVRQITTGDLMLLNELAGYSEEELASSEEARLRLMHTIIHEAAHSTEALLNVAGARPANFAGGWRPPSRDAARETIDRVRLRKSLIQEWQRVHASFVRQGWAASYPSSPAEREAIRSWTPHQVVQGGAMSRYGASSYPDDIADMIAWTYMASHYRAAGIPDGVRQTEDFACQQFRTHGANELPGRFAAAYTKLLFLQDLGVVKPADVQTCVGQVGLPLSGSGFDVWQGGDHRSSYDTGVQARIGTSRGRYKYEMNAEGRAEFRDTMYPATIRLVLDLDDASVPLDEVAWPRGVYPLGLLAANNFHLRLDGASAASFDVHDGYALVAEASNQRIAGSVFIRIGFRLGAPLPVPQTFDPPAIVRFLIEK